MKDFYSCYVCNESIISMTGVNNDGWKEAVIIFIRKHKKCMEIYDNIGFLFMRLLDLFWHIGKREFTWSIRKIRKEENIVYYDYVFGKEINKKAE